MLGIGTNNPFEDIRAVNQVENFFGREEMIDYLFNSSINIKAPVCVALEGEVGIGKSSILNYLFLEGIRGKYNVEPDKIMVQVNFSDPVYTIEDFYRLLHLSLNDAIQFHQEMEDDFKEEMDRLCDKNMEQTSNYRIQTDFKNVLNALKVRGYKIIYVIDNLEKIITDININKEEFTFLRSLSDNSTKYNVQYIISTTKDLKIISKAAGSSGFDTIFKVRHVSLFSDEEMESYINKPFSRSGFKLRDDELTDLRKLSGGNPMILRAGCKVLFDNKAAGRKIKSFDYFVDEVVKECRGYFEYLWDHTEEEEIALYKDFISGWDINNSEYLKEPVRRNILKNMEGEVCFVSKAYECFIRKALEEYKFKEKSSTAYKAADTQTAEGHMGKEEFAAILQEIKDYIKRITTDSIGTTINYLMPVIENLYEIKYDSLVTKVDINDDESVDAFADRVKDYMAERIEKKDIKELSSLTDMAVAKIWDEIGNPSKEFFIIGENLNGMFNRIKMDLAAVSICYCKGVELEINRVILPMLREKFPECKIKRPNGEYDIMNIRSIMIGEFYFLVNNFYSDIKKELTQYIDSKGIKTDEFIKNLGDIKNIRNNTAHGGYTIKKHEITQLRKAAFGGRRSFIENMIILGS